MDENTDGAVRELIAFSITGVQRYITQSRTTRDVAAASRLMSDLAMQAIQAADGKGEVVLPAPSPEGGPSTTEPDLGVPNRVLVLARQGEGVELAKAMSAAVRSSWAARVEATFGDKVEVDPHFPGIEWTIATTDAGSADFAALWERSQGLSTARKYSRVFTPFADRRGWKGRRGVCSLMPDWPAVKPPARAREFDKKETLSQPAWVKRQALLRGDERLEVPSTWDIASALYREDIASLYREDIASLSDGGEPGALTDALEALWLHFEGTIKPTEVDVDEFRKSGSGHPPLGPMASWVYAQRWTPAAVEESVKSGAESAGDWSPEDAAAKGAELATALQRAAEETGEVRRLTPYYAVILQDLDSLGERMDGIATTEGVKGCRKVSRELVGLAASQRERVRGHRGMTVYAGGDDLLALVPADVALTCARQLREQVDKLTPTDPRRPLTASTAVLFVHAQMSLSSVLAEAHQRLDSDAKGLRGKDGLCVAFHKRAGSSSRVTVPWGRADDVEAAVTAFASGALSQRIIPTLRRGFFRGGDGVDESPSGYPIRRWTGNRAPLMDLYHHATNNRGTVHEELFDAEMRRIVSRHVEDCEEERALKAAEEIAELITPKSSQRSPAEVIALLRVAHFVARGVVEDD